MNDSTLITVLLTIAVACALAQVVLILINAVAYILGLAEDKLNELKQLKIQAFRDYKTFDAYLKINFGVKTLSELNPKDYEDVKLTLLHLLSKDPEHDLKKAQN